MHATTTPRAIQELQAQCHADGVAWTHLHGLIRDRGVDAARDWATTHCFWHLDELLFFHSAWLDDHTG